MPGEALSLAAEALGAAMDVAGDATGVGAGIEPQAATTSIVAARTAARLHDGPRGAARRARVVESPLSGDSSGRVRMAMVRMGSSHPASGAGAPGPW